MTDPKIEGEKNSAGQKSADATATEASQFERHPVFWVRARKYISWRWELLKGAGVSNRLVAVATVVIAVAGAFTWWEAHNAGAQTEKIIAADVRLASAMEKSVVQANKALDASIDSSRNDQRAWVGVISINGSALTEGTGAAAKRVYIKEGETVVFGANVQNSGKSIAKNVRSCVTFDIVATTQPFVPRVCEPTQQPAAVLQPNVTVIVPTEGQPAGAKMPREEVEALKSGTAKCYLHGWVSYEDIFNRPHRFKFLMVLNPDLTFFSSYGGKEYNDAD